MGRAERNVVAAIVGLTLSGLLYAGINALG